MRADQAFQDATAGLIKASCGEGIVTIYHSPGAKPEYEVRLVPRGPDQNLKMQEMTSLGTFQNLQEAEAEASRRFGLTHESWMPQNQIELVEDRTTGGLQVEPPHGSA